MGEISSLIPFDSLLNYSFFVAILLDINVLLPILELPTEYCFLTGEIVYIKVVHHLHRVFAAVVPLVISLKNYSQTRIKF